MKKFLLTLTLFFTVESWAGNSPITEEDEEKFLTTLVVVGGIAFLVAASSQYSSEYGSVDYMYFVEQMKQLKQENQSLIERLEHAKQELAHKHERISDLKMKLEAVQTAKSINGVGRSSTKAKRQIDKLIYEIDACLDALSLSTI